MTTDDPWGLTMVPDPIDPTLLVAHRSPHARLDRRPFWDRRAAEPRSPERDAAPNTLDALRWLEFGAWEVPALAWPTSGEYLDRCQVLADASVGLDAIRV